ncbi:MAG TPA: hypothetical protein VLI05_04335 [Candidatus Saccharimonadia bacterium]|nr:hypothetical protein [Candidatus Saccharimonadia bacterium]
MSWLLWPGKIKQTIYFGQTTITNGELRHTGGHECLVASNAQPNALLLPVPTVELSPPFKSPTGGPCLLRDIAATHYPGLHDLPRRPPQLNDEFTRTITMADARPETFAAALKANNLPHGLRPTVNEKLLAEFAKRYPDWPLLVRLIAPIPPTGQALPLPRLLYSYEPADPARLFFPTAEPRHSPSTGGFPQPMTGLTDAVVMLGHPDGDPITYCSTPARGSLLPEGTVSLYLARQRPPGDPRAGQTFGNLWVNTRDITSHSLPRQVAAQPDGADQEPLYFTRKATALFLQE